MWMETQKANRDDWLSCKITDGAVVLLRRHKIEGVAGVLCIWYYAA